MLSVKMRAISPITALPATPAGLPGSQSHMAASSRKITASTNDTTWPSMKSQSPILNQRRQYSCACAGSAETSTARSLLDEPPNGSNRFASPSRSS